MKKHVKKIITSFIFISILFSLISCSKGEKNPALEFPPAEGCRVSSIRTGTEQQGIVSLQNGFECTEDGAYFMCSVGVEDWLLYVDHGSDTVIKLCGRPDCAHSGSDCNAYFSSASNICYYDGYLYTYGSLGESILGGRGLIRMNLDGSGRELVYNVSDLMADGGYRGTVSPTIRNGIFSIGLTKLDENGRTVSNCYYYKLDGSMKEAMPLPGLGNVKTDGSVFCGLIGYDQNTKEYIYGKLDLDKGATEIFRDLKFLETGYFAADAYFYVENGIIYEYSYDTGNRIPLLDTKLKGKSHHIRCFPDIIVVSEYVSTEDRLNGVGFDDLTLHFFDWSFRSLGSVNIDYEFNPGIPGVICGETHERLMLTDAYDLVPRYYINKSDIGSGRIEIHKYNLPDFE